METWKLLIGLTGLLVVFTAVGEITNTSLSSPDGVLTLVGIIIFAVLFFVMSRFGYRIGQNYQEDVSDED